MGDNRANQLTMLRSTMYLLCSAAVSFCFAALPAVTGPFLTHGEAPVVVLIFLMTQLVLIVHIIVRTGDGKRWLPVLLAVPVSAWTLWCSFIAAMAYAGTWL